MFFAKYVRNRRESRSVYCYPTGFIRIIGNTRERRVGEKSYVAASVGNREFPLFPILVLLSNRPQFNLLPHDHEIQTLCEPGNVSLVEADVTPIHLVSA